MNKQFPNLKLETLYGDTISIQDYKGKYLVINWWATSCINCWKEIPGLNKLVEKYKSNKDIVFLAIAFDKRDVLEHDLRKKEFNYLHAIWR